MRISGLGDGPCSPSDGVTCINGTCIPGSMADANGICSIQCVGGACPTGSGVPSPASTSICGGLSVDFISGFTTWFSDPSKAIGALTSSQAWQCVGVAGNYFNVGVLSLPVVAVAAIMMMGRRR